MLNKSAKSRRQSHRTRRGLSLAPHSPKPSLNHKPNSLAPWLTSNRPFTQNTDASAATAATATKPKSQKAPKQTDDQQTKRPMSMPTGAPPKTPKKASDPTIRKPASTKNSSASKATTPTKKSTLPVFQFDKPAINELYLRPPSELTPAQFLTLLKVTPPQHFQNHLDHYNSKINDLFDTATPLTAVTAKGKFDMMKELHTRGAQLGVQDTNGDAPLHVAVRGGNVDIIRWLLIRGADPHQVNPITKLSPLMTAAKTFHHAAADMLLQQNTNSDQQNELGQSALMIAAQFSSRQMIETLHSYGADIELFDNDGYTAYDYANMHKRTQMISILHLCYSGKRKPKFNPLTPEFLARKKEKEMKQEAFELRDQIFDSNGRFLPQFIELIWKSVQHSEMYMQTGLFPDSVEIVVKKHKDQARHFTSHQDLGVSAAQVGADGQQSAPNQSQSGTGLNSGATNPLHAGLGMGSPTSVSNHDPFAAFSTTSSSISPLAMSPTTSPLLSTPFHDNTHNTHNNTHNQPIEGQNEAYIISPDGSVRTDHSSRDALNSSSPFTPSQHDPFSPDHRHTTSPAFTTSHSPLTGANYDPFQQSNDHNEHQHGWGESSVFAHREPLSPRSVLDGPLVGKVGLQSYHRDLEVLRRQQDMLHVSQYEASLPNRNKALRSSTDYVVTKMTIQQPFEILRNQATIVLDRKKAPKNAAPRDPSTLQGGFDNSHFVANTPDQPSPINEDPEALNLDPGFHEAAPTLHHKSWHQALKKHTINPSKSHTKTAAGDRHSGFDRSKLSQNLSVPALNKDGRVINPKKMTLDDFGHLLNTSAQNKNVLLQDYVKEQQRHQYDKYGGDGIADSKVVLGIRGAHGQGTTQHKVKTVIREGFREVNRVKVGSKIVSLENTLESNILDVAALIDDIEGRGESQLMNRSDTIETLKKKEFKKNQLRYLTPRPSASDMVHIDYNNPIATAGTVIKDARTIAEVSEKYGQADEKIKDERKQRLRLNEQGQMIDTVKLKKMQNLERKLHRDDRNRQKEALKADKDSV